MILSLIWVVAEGNFIPSWFFHSNSETVKAITLTFCSIQKLFIRNYLPNSLPNLVSRTHSSLQILGKTQTGVFPISKLMVNPLKMKTFIVPKPVMILTWNLDQQLNLTANCNVIAIFPAYGRFGAIQQPVSARMICKLYIFINSYLLSYKT